MSIRMLLFPFECFEFLFEYFESRLKGSNLYSNASNVVLMLRMSFERLEFAFECFESLTSGSGLDSNASNPF